MNRAAVAAYLGNVKRRRGRVLPPPPDGFHYQLDENGNYVRDENGDPILVEDEEE